MQFRQRGEDGEAAPHAIKGSACYRLPAFLISKVSAEENVAATEVFVTLNGYIGKYLSASGPDKRRYESAAEEREKTEKEGKEWRPLRLGNIVLDPECVSSEGTRLSRTL